MGLFSLFRKNKQDSASDQGTFRSRADEQSSVIRSRNSRSTANGSGRAASGRAKAGKDAADPLLPEKKRARRRLIGAVALALAVVIVLPMILDSEPKPLNEDIAIQIPSKDAPVADMTQPGRSDPKQASLDQKEEIVEPASIAPEPASPTPAPAPAAAQPETPPVVAAPKVVEKPVEKLVEKHQEKPIEKPVEKPTEKPAAKTEHKEEPKKEAAKPKAPAATDDDAARALAILEGKSGAAAAPAEKKPAAAGGKFVIQVAALATQDKVNELRNKLSAAGIHSYTQKIATQAGDRTRIRVGPFASREEAERMGGRIKKLGLNATIVPA
ncbi:SPOR domain-containing protein [Herbaspirillum rubrisubalbicans]|uniref:SPOR domain-containing protein n=1 Tax=Herbaspirillum rubrisubalbicans TaxID=80842 RepID=UPI001558F599|nr:SPOR domain-containing protein [Herbaspirillum rubrisubalbicans]NQE48025.1 lipoprotein [Herbaspirillum rubrisubalbicans]